MTDDSGLGQVDFYFVAGPPTQWNLAFLLRLRTVFRLLGLVATVKQSPVGKIRREEAKTKQKMNNLQKN